MPGNLMSASLLYREELNFSVEALTDVDYCGINRDDLQGLIKVGSPVLGTFFDINAKEGMTVDQRLVDLGTCSAEERVARLMLEIMERQQRRDRVHDQRFEFPLKQIHLADALGLTQVHVNRVLKRFREAGLIEWSRGVLKIVDVSAMKQIADIR
jgi:CRP-like cAMP-binding protein